MAELTPEIASEVVAACQAGAGEVAEALSRALDQTIEVTPGESAPLDPEQRTAELAEPGLAVVMTFGDVGAVAVLSESSGLLPDWCAEPDATGESKLSTLAQELSMLLVPETLMADQFQATRVENLAEALAAGQLADDAVRVLLELSAGESKGTLSVIWPLAAPGAMLGSDDAEEAATDEAGTDETATEKAAEAASSEAPATRSVAATKETESPEKKLAGIVQQAGVERGIERLPAYTQSLLRIRVPVVVTLASKKQPVSQIISLGPGSIINFEKSCDELLDLEVGGQRIARGEAVKVGDKFGLRINSIALPDERFHRVQPPAQPSLTSVTRASIMHGLLPTSIQREERVR